jgi:hypothetical protein
MKGFHPVLPALSALCLLAAPARAQQSIRPGYWESTERVDAPITTTKTEQRCVTPKDIAKFMSCYINHHYQCLCPEQAIGDGRIAFKGECVDHKNQHVRIEGTGTFTATTLHMEARAGFKLLGLPLDADASTDAHRLGDTCPPGSTGGPPSDGQPETFQ